MDAVILGGGDVKGAFGAAALEVLANEGCRIGRIVGASSGALNAVVFAAGVRLGCAHEAAGVAVELWRDADHWRRFLDIDPAAVVSARGLSDSRRVADLIGRTIDQLPRPESQAVELKIVVTLLNGSVVKTTIGDATTFEGVLRFTGSDLDSNEGVAFAVRAAVASAAFPGLFAPVDLDEHGPALDGGMVRTLH